MENDARATQRNILIAFGVLLLFVMYRQTWLLERAQDMDSYRDLVQKGDVEIFKLRRLLKSSLATNAQLEAVLQRHNISW
jgi:hypothetical protein